MKAKWGRYFLLVTAVIAAYLNSFWGAFQFDDYNVIVDNPEIHSLTAWFSGLPQGIRPLLKLTYLLNWTCGEGLFGFHLFNVSVHAVNAVLIYRLSQRFFGHCLSNRQDVEHAALLTALLFALHPVQTEAVTYISGRSMSLMAMFYLGSMLAYAQGVDEGRTSLQYVLSPLLFAAAVAVRETAVTLPFAIVLWEAGRGQPTGLRVLVQRKLVHWGMLAGFLLLLIVHPTYSDLLDFSLQTRSLGINLLSQVNGVFYLLSRFIFLHRLSIDPGLPLLSAWDLPLVAECAVLLTLLITGFAALRNRPWLGFGLLWFFLHLMPTNSIIPRLDIANERHLYLAGWGIELALSGEFMRLRAIGTLNTRKIRAAAALALVVVMVFTVMRNHTYRSEVSLWEDTVEKSPMNARAHNNLGFAYADTGRFREALAEYRAALCLRPGYETAKENLDALRSSMADERGLPGGERLSRER